MLSQKCMPIKLKTDTHGEHDIDAAGMLLHPLKEWFRFVASAACETGVDHHVIYLECDYI